MARIRTIKPEFPQSESMGRVSREARLLFVMLWTVIDDEGRVRGNSRMLASLLFPYDDDAPGLIDGWMIELEREGCLVRYKVNGQSYLQICNWLIHQKIDKPSKSKIPPFNGDSQILANPLEWSSEDQYLVSSTKDLVSSTNKENPRPEKKEDAADAPLQPQAAAVESIPTDKPDRKPKGGSQADMHAELERRGVTAAVALAFIKARQKKKADLSLVAIDGLQAEAQKAGLTLNDALSKSCTRGWIGFEADWLLNQSRVSPQSNPLRQQPKPNALDAARAAAEAVIARKFGNTVEGEARYVGEVLEVRHGNA